MSRRDLTVSSDVAGSPLDEALCRLLPGLDRKAARALIERGAVFAGGKRVRRIERVAEGTRLVVHLDAPEPVTALELPVIFEDARLIVLDKPAGIHLNETESTARPSVVDRLAPRFPGIHVVHRLDLDTSGVVVLAKDAESAELLSRLFRERRVEKTYVALVQGTLEDGLIDAPIARDRRRPSARRVAAGGQEARTEIETLGRASGLSAIAARPITGRTHQIRVHVSHRGAPILGDRLYGGPTAVRAGDEVVRLARPLLHARRLTLELPEGPRTFEAPVPPDLADFERFGLSVQRA